MSRDHAVTGAGETGTGQTAGAGKAGTLYCDPQALRAFTTEIFQRFGLARDAAAIVADNLVHADLRGHGSHGVTRIPIYTKRLACGVVKAEPQIAIESGGTSVVRVDGDNGMGAVAGDTAMKQSIRLARQHGVGIATVRNSNHTGPGSFYVMQASDQGLIGVSASNSPVSMAVWGSRGRALGTNPLSVSVPAGRHDAIVVDMSSSVVARGKIVEASKRGDPIPEGWALDKDGKPTTDSVEAEAGVVLPFAGAKGSAIAILVDVLAGVLSGAAYGSLIQNLYAEFEQPQNNGQFTMAIDVSAFMPPAMFSDRIDGFIDLMKAAPVAEGVSEVLVPGEPETRNHKKHLRTGVPLPENVVADIRAVAETVDLALPPLSEGPLSSNPV